MDNDCDTSLSDNYCLICGSSSVDGASDDDDDNDGDKIAKMFLNCVDLTENYNDFSQDLHGIEFCLKCKLKLEELDYVQSQIDRLLLRAKQLKMSIIAAAVEQSSVPLENSSASWIRRLIRNKFHPWVLLKKCDSEQLKIPKGRPRNTISVARKRPTTHSWRVSAEPKKIQMPENTVCRSTMEEFDASSLLHIKFEQFDSEEMEDFEMRDPLELDGNEVAQVDNSLILKNEGSDIEVDGTPGRTLKQPALSDTSVPTVTPLYKLLPSTVDSQMGANRYPALSTDDDPSSLRSLRSEQKQLVRVEGNSYRFGEFPVERMGNSYNCLTCATTFSGMNSAFRVKKHIRDTHESRQDNSINEISPQDILCRDNIRFTFDENEGSVTCEHCGVKFISSTMLSGKEKIMKHMKEVHTLEDVVQKATAEGLVNGYKIEGVRVNVINDRHICGACSKGFKGRYVRQHVMMHIRQCHLKAPQFTWKSVKEVKPGEYLYKNKLPFSYKDGSLHCGLCPRNFLTDEKGSSMAETKIVLHLKLDHSGMLDAPAGEGEKSTEGMASPVGSIGTVRSHCPNEPKIPTNQKKKPAERVRTVQNVSAARSTVVSEPTPLLEEVRQQTAEEGQRGSYSYEFQGVRVTVINEEHACEAEGCSKVCMGKWAPQNVMNHIRACHLKQPTFKFKGVIEVKPGEFLYGKKLPFTFKAGIIQCGLCPRYFVADKGHASAAAKEKIISHLKQEHLDERKTLTDPVKNLVESEITIQNYPALMKTVASQPVTLLGQGSPSVFHIQPYRLLQNGQTVYTVVAPVNPIQPLCVTQPAVSLQNGSLGQFDSDTLRN